MVSFFKYHGRNMAIFSRPDLEMLKKLSETPSVGQENVRQQGVYESLFRDIIAGYGKWEFDPTDIKNPFPNNEGSVHIWQGYEDKIISRKLNRYLQKNFRGFDIMRFPMRVSC